MQTTTTINQHRQHDYERFEANRRFEEMTDIAERLGYPIDITIQYEMRDGVAYGATDSKNRPFHNQTLQAKLTGEHVFTGDQAFEYTRLCLEHEEALMVDQFGNGELDGNVLIKYSKVPDAVVDDRTDIKGYRRDLLRSFVRVYYRTEQGVSCRLFTLDHNSQLGTHNVGQLLDINTSAPSEDVLADYTLIEAEGDLEDFVEALTNETIYAYDAGMMLETGSVTHAGSMYTDKYDAMKVISDSSHLMSQHMDALSRIIGYGLEGESLEIELESERKRTAAAIKLASQGAEVGSSSDVSVSAEVASGDYGRGCATATGMNQAAQSMENKWTPGECRVCFVKTMVGSCAVCSSCATADDRGVDLLKLRDRNIRARESQRKIASRAIRSEDYPREQKQTEQQRLESQFGEQIAIHTIKTVGGAYRVVVGKRTHKTLARL